MIHSHNAVRVLHAIGIFLLALILYWGVRFAHTASISKRLVERSVPYQNVSNDHAWTMLVIGDSTAVGVGATTPEQSLAGRVALRIGATYTENHAVSGALVNDLPKQIAEAKLQEYDLILVQIGANDIVRFHDAKATTAELARYLDTLPKTKKLILVSAGDVGAATLIPPPLRPFYTKLNRSYHAEYARAFPDSYVNLGTGPGSQLFKERPDVYLAADGFHPSSAGYGIWFDAVAPKLSE